MRSNIVKTGDYMLSKTFSVMIMVSFVSAVFTGRLDEMSNAFASSVASALDLVISLAGMMCFWSGFMNVLKDADIVDFIGRLLRPAINLVYGNVDDETAENISASVGANFLGLGNAALPLGIRVMKSFERNNNTGAASDNSIMFAVLNTVPFQLIPTTLVAMRSKYGSVNPFDVIPAIWISSVLINAFAVIVCKIMCKLSRGWKQ